MTKSITDEWTEDEQQLYEDIVDKYIADMNHLAEQGYVNPNNLHVKAEEFAYHIVMDHLVKKL